MKNKLNKYHLSNLKTSINKYGFNYRTRDFVFLTVGIILLMFLLSYISRLKAQYILIQLFITMLLLPFLIIAFFNQAYIIKKFTMVSDYLENIIPIFTQKTKIRYTLGELLEINTGEMKTSIKKAIDYLDKTMNDSNASKNALKIIEHDFPNSRIKSVHKLLLSIEAANSVDYEEVCANMYKDIEGWIKRVYTFEKDLKNRRTKLIILCLSTLFLNCIFVYLYVSNEYFVGFVKENVYQISTLLFISSVLIIVTLIMTRLHGEWLVNDLNYLNDEKIKREYQIYKQGKQRISIVDIVIFIICVGCSFLLYFYDLYSFAIVSIIFGLYILIRKRIKYRQAFKTLSKALTIEFPVWLREISLTLNSFTVLNAIEYSQNNASYALRSEIRSFLNEAKKDPTSIKPYMDFLKDFDLEDARSSMKVLYSLQNIGKEDMKDRVSNLIERNQVMLEKSESLRNNDSIGGIEALGYVPTVLFSFHMMICMFAMFSYMMNTIEGAIHL